MGESGIRKCILVEVFETFRLKNNKVRMISLTQLKNVAASDFNIDLNRFEEE